MKRTLLALVSLLLVSASADAAPSVSGVTGVFSHNGTITVSGSDFGSKSPAAPLWWDNMEGASDGGTTFTTGELSWVTSGVLSGSGKHYSEVNNVGNYTDANITYRSTGWRSVSGPHSRSSKYATGAHWQYADNNPPYAGSGDGEEGYDNVNLTVDSGTADKDIWYVHYYYRADPQWTLVNDYDGTYYSNHKKSAVNYGTMIYDAPTCYVVSQTESKGRVTGDLINYDIAVIVGGDCTRTETLTGANAKDSWVAIEQLWDSPSGLHEIWTFDGSAGGSGKKNYSDPSDADCRDRKNDTRSFSVGGWFCTNTNLVESEKRGHQNNYRYFDDLYVDNTFSRVVLANSATYASATIVEPQIPSAWAAGEITATLNQGALPDGTAYLFVFDSANAANAVGYEVTIGGGTTAFGSGSGSMSIGGGSGAATFR